MPITQVLIILLVSTSGSFVLVSLLIRLLFHPLRLKKIAGIKLQGILPANQAALSNEIAAFISQPFLSPQNLEEKIVSPIILQKLKPEIELHIDHFLKVKLEDAFPLLSKLMGEKTLNRFKQAFLTEVEILFPNILKNYAANLLNELSIEKINQLFIPAIEKVFLVRAAKQLNILRLIGAVFGLFIGLLQVLIIIFCK